MPVELNCWKCGASLQDVPLPFSRYAKCKSCQSELHVCRMCLFYDKTVSKMCREPIAEEVKDKQRANFCGYLQPKPGAYSAAPPSSGNANLAALFGMQAGATAGSPTDAQAAKRKLEELFGLGNKKK